MNTKTPKLNENLISKDSLAVQNKDFKTAFELDSQFDRNAIGKSKIRNFSFSQGNGGTLVLGGLSNGNGLMIVKNSSGGTIVTINNSGIFVDNGNIVITNATGGTVLDGSGIVSTTSFPSDYVFSNTLGSTTSTSFVAVPGASLTSFVLSRAAKVLIFTSIFGYNKHYYQTGNLLIVQGTDSIDGQVFSIPLKEATDVVNVNFAGSSFSTRFSDDTASIQVISTLSAGTHILSLNYKVDSGGTGIIEDYAYGYVVLGN